MKIINNQKELFAYTEHDDSPYDVDAHWVIHEMDYKYPIMVDCVGMTHLGMGYKVYVKEDFDEIRKFLQL